MVRLKNFVLIATFAFVLSGATNLVATAETGGHDKPSNEIRVKTFAEIPLGSCLPTKQDDEKKVNPLLKKLDSGLNRKESVSAYIKNVIVVPLYGPEMGYPWGAYRLMNRYGVFSAQQALVGTHTRIPEIGEMTTESISYTESRNIERADVGLITFFGIVYRDTQMYVIDGIGSDAPRPGGNDKRSQAQKSSKSGDDSRDSSERTVYVETVLAYETPAFASGFTMGSYMQAPRMEPISWTKSVTGTLGQSAKDGYSLISFVPGHKTMPKDPKKVLDMKTDRLKWGDAVEMRPHAFRQDNYMIAWWGPHDFHSDWWRGLADSGENPMPKAIDVPSGTTPKEKPKSMEKIFVRGINVGKKEDFPPYKMTWCPYLDKESIAFLLETPSAPPSAEALLQSMPILRDSEPVTWGMFMPPISFDSNWGATGSTTRGVTLAFASPKPLVAWMAARSHDMTASMDRPSVPGNPKYDANNARYADLSGAIYHAQDGSALWEDAWESQEWRNVFTSDALLYANLLPALSTRPILALGSASTTDKNTVTDKGRRYEYPPEIIANGALSSTKKGVLSNLLPRQNTEGIDIGLGQENGFDQQKIAESRKKELLADGDVTTEPTTFDLYVSGRDEITIFPMVRDGGGSIKPENEVFPHMPVVDATNDMYAKVYAMLPPPGKPASGFMEWGGNMQNPYPDGPPTEEEPEAPTPTPGTTSPTPAVSPNPEVSPTPGENGWPVEGKVTSEYGNRKDPFTGEKSFHGGMDIKCTTGCPIRAPRSGKVIFSGWKKGYGNTIMIDHGDGTVTLYGHCSSLSSEVGQSVAPGLEIAKCGSTGKSTGSHLHFEVRRNGHVINPRSWLKGL